MDEASKTERYARLEHIKRDRVVSNVLEIVHSLGPTFRLAMLEDPAEREDIYKKTIPKFLDAIKQLAGIQGYIDNAELHAEIEEVLSQGLTNPDSAEFIERCSKLNSAVWNFLVEDKRVFIQSKLPE